MKYTLTKERKFLRVRDIIRMIQDNFLLAFILVGVLVVVLAVGYFLIYRKLLKGDKKLSKLKTCIWFCFIGYMIMVIGVTFIGRGVRLYGDSNLHFLSTYKEAWNSFSFGAWTQLVLNIIMLVPFGMLLPLLNNRFRKFKWTLGASLILTLTIETMQLVTGYGVFDVDDIFNNILGAIMGYGIVMTAITLREGKKEKYKKSIVYLLPLIVVIISSITVVGVYNAKEFGNLFITHKYKINMKNIELSLNYKIEDTKEVFLNDNKYKTEEVPIYKSKVYDKESGKKFFRDFLKDKDIDEEIEVDPYDTMAIYWYRDKGYNMWFNYSGGTYDYTDFSSLDEGVERADVDKETVIEELAKFDITIPETAVLSKGDDTDKVGIFQWDVENYIDGDYITNGRLYVKYYNDATIKGISNSIIKYEKVRNIPIKSKEEVYKELEEGKFNILYRSEDISKIEVEDIKLSYMLDTKGFYQPIYKINARIDGEDSAILIPAM